MMHNTKWLPVLLLFILLTVAGCTAAGDTAELPQTTVATPVFVSEWPENIYTGKIPQPQNATPDYIIDDSQNGRYSVFVKDLDPSAYTAYIETLRAQGYNEVASAENDVSSGLMLSGNGATLHIAYSGSNMGITITMGNSGNIKETVVAIGY